jgi:hypothetical protein
MNKKGDITVTILVIGVFVVCTLAMAIFFLSSLQRADGFVDVGLIEKVSQRMENGDKFISDEDTGKLCLIESKKVRESWYSLRKTKEVFYVKYFK